MLEKEEEKLQKRKRLEALKERYKISSISCDVYICILHIMLVIDCDSGVVRLTRLTRFVQSLVIHFYLMRLKKKREKGKNDSGNRRLMTTTRLMNLSYIGSLLYIG
jgi:hypothetical protein